MATASKPDLQSLNAMTDAEQQAAALNDPDNQPWTDTELARVAFSPRTKTMRRALRLSQEEFAARYRIPVGTLRDWEQGRFEPDATARAYLTVIALEPELIRNLLATRSGAGDPASEKTTDTAR